MGANQSINPAHKSEQELLSWGVGWWKRWKEAKGLASGAPISFDAHDVKIDEESHIHTVRMTTEEKGASTSAPLVMMHGYGSGIGIYYTALPQLAERWKGDVFAIDSFGCGLSSRHKWTGGYGAAAGVDNVETYFIDALESWRTKMGLEKIVLMGHSVGGYLACAYAERYPNRLERVILVSPVGVPHPPEGHENRYDDRPWYFRTAMSMWENGWSPFDIPGKATLLNKYFGARFADKDWVNKDLLAQYWYHNWTNGEPSGGAYAHSTLLKPGAFARSPLCERIPHLNIPQVTFIYGDKDWMDWRHAKTVKEGLGEATTLEADNTEIVLVDGGHNMMIDNPVAFVDAVVHDGATPRADATFYNRRVSIDVEVRDADEAHAPLQA